MCQIHRRSPADRHQPIHEAPGVPDRAVVRARGDGELWRACATRHAIRRALKCRLDGGGGVGHGQRRCSPRRHTRSRGVDVVRAFLKARTMHAVEKIADFLALFGPACGRGRFTAQLREKSDRSSHSRHSAASSSCSVRGGVHQAHTGALPDAVTCWNRTPTHQTCAASGPSRSVGPRIKLRFGFEKTATLSVRRGAAARCRPWCLAHLGSRRTHRYSACPPQPEIAPVAVWRSFQLRAHCSRKGTSTL